MMQKLKFILAGALWLCAGNIFAAADPQVEAFIDRMVEQHQFDRTELTQVLAQAEKKQSILDKISKPAERTLNWDQYKEIFLTQKRIKQGVEFWERNQATLEKAQQEFGVPPSIIVAIIGVETFYGRITGRDRVLDALYTLGFYYPKRSAFFLGELEQFLLLTREEEMDPTLPKGSYAGAMGLGQFMPNSYRAYAVDFNGDGKRDIWTSEVDAIGSVANYFARHYWTPGQQVTRLAKGADSRHGEFVKAGMKPSISIETLRTAGIDTGNDLPSEMLSSLVKLETFNGPEYWLGLPNFYVITRYNHSNMYAMAVYQLGQQIEKQIPDSR